jgi:membrane fusion protein (multidrug efflux system)
MTKRIPLPGPGRSLAGGLAALAALATLATLATLGGGAGCARGRAAEDGASARPVKAHVVPVSARNVNRTVDSVGSLFAFEEVTVGSEVEGRVAQVFVDVGDRVAAGRPLVKIVPVELGLTLQQERAALEQIQARLTMTGGGQAVAPKDAAEVKRADADRTDAEQKYLRAKQLLGEGLISKGTYDEAEARYNGARAAYDMSVQNVLTLRAQAAQRTASVALADKKLRDTVIRAPFGGQVKDRMVSPGQYVKVQTPVMVIVDSNRLRARLKVPEKMAAWVAVGQPVKVLVEAYPGRAFEGTVWRMSPSVDPQTRSFDVEALLENGEGLLKPGFFARASIVTSRVDQALVVPQEALRYLYGVYKVYRVEKSALRETEVKLGPHEGTAVEIVSGLKDGERVAVPLEGEEMRDGAPVTAVP